MYPRFIIGYPAIAIVMAVGIYYIPPMLLTRFKDRRLMTGATAVLVVAISIVQINYYFNEHIPALKQEIFTRTASPDVTDAMIRSANIPPGSDLFMISNVPADIWIAKAELALFRWNQLLPYVNIYPMTPDQITPAYLRSLPLDRDRAFFVEPGQDGVIALIKSAFVVDDAQYSPQTDIPPGKAFILYYAPLNKQHKSLHDR
ncbi:MAG: hypothetical protein ACYDBJ_19510 [Aggregatilineales bacterium]